MQLSIHHITKQYKNIIAVDDFDVKLTPGIWGLLGANGAGKTTLIRMICGILTPTQGSVAYDDVPILDLGENYRNVLGYLPQSFGFYPEFSVLDYLHYMAMLKGLSKRESEVKIDYLINLLTMTEVKKYKIRKLSGGMQRRVGIAQALLNDPKILVLDEPTSGLDPSERVHFRNIISEFSRNRIVLISTHIVSDIEYIAKQNIIMKSGKLIRVGTSEDLSNEIKGKVWEVSLPSANFTSFENERCIVNSRNQDDGNILVRYVSDLPNMPGSRNVEPRLEDLYLWLFHKERGDKEQ